ncbi:MAG: branched-chain amino acid ABC transporter permease [Deferribacteraceae bacterium]|jgi:branched-chain amino acid transport system permease protein|nr:branched-chain amino acid ABC transporter permease [Deferribacteraceae bacterium]
MIFLQQLINGLTYGSLLGFIALGYTMVYGVLKLINFAHGDVVTLAAFLSITFIPIMGILGSVGTVVIILLVMASICIVAAVLERFAYRPLRSAPRLSLIVSALGAGMVIQNAIMLIWGANPRVFPSELIPQKLYKFQWAAEAGAEVQLASEFTITSLSIFTLLLNIIVMTFLIFFIHKTRSGIAIKALSIDYTTAQLMGVNINRTITLVFVIGGAIGALGGILIGANYNTVPFNMGFEYGIKAFIAAILGGIGSIPGAMFGGILLGLVYTFSAGYLSTVWADSFAYGLLIILLIFRPNGIFGEITVHKV